MKYGKLTGTLKTPRRGPNDLVPLEGVITATAQFNHAVVTDTSGYNLVLPAPFNISVVGGVITDGTNPYVELMATSQPDSNPPTFLYRLTFDLYYNDVKVRWQPFNILLPPDIVTDLANAVPVPNQPSPGLVIGNPGRAGDSAYEVAVDAGFSGTIDQWLESLKGAQGEPGDGGTGLIGDGAVTFSKLSDALKAMVNASQPVFYYTIDSYGLVHQKFGVVPTTMGYATLDANGDFSVPDNALLGEKSIYLGLDRKPYVPDIEFRIDPSIQIVDDGSGNFTINV